MWVKEGAERATVAGVLATCGPKGGTFVGSWAFAPSFVLPLLGRTL